MDHGRKALGVPRSDKLRCLHRAEFGAHRMVDLQLARLTHLEGFDVSVGQGTGIRGLDLGSVNGLYYLMTTEA